MNPNSNPFVVGIPILPDQFIGRNSIIQAAFDQIHHRGHLAVWGGLGTGKTSLLIKLASPETWQQHNVDPSSAVIIRFSCEEISPFTPFGFWKNVLSLLKDNLEEEPQLQTKINNLLAENQASVDNLRQILKGLGQKAKFLVLLIDDYDLALIQNSEYSEENMQQFLSEFRKLAVHSDVRKNLSVIVTSKKRLNDLDPQFNPHQSPWYNHYLFQQIKQFDDREITQLLQPFNRPITEELRQAIEEVTGGHPALLQIANFLLYQQLRNNVPPQVEEFVTAFENSTQQFFANTWQRCSSKEQNLLMLMTLTKLRGRLDKKRQYDLKDVDLVFTQSGRDLGNLEEQGVIKRAANYSNIPYLLTSSLMEKWVIQEIWNSDEESLLERQKEFLNLMSHKQAENIKNAMVWVGQNRSDVISAFQSISTVVAKILKFFGII